MGPARPNVQDSDQYPAQQTGEHDWALLMTPGQRRIRLHAQSYRCNLTGDHVLAFLKHLLRQVPGPIVLVWDKASIHQRQKVQEFLAQHPRIHGYNFPTSAPELNPVEFVWTQMEEYLASSAPEDIDQLGSLVQAALRRTRVSQSRLWSCLHASDLPWKRDRVRH
jgi:transposase